MGLICFQNKMPANEVGWSFWYLFVAALPRTGERAAAAPSVGVCSQTRMRKSRAIERSFSQLELNSPSHSLMGVETITPSQPTELLLRVKVNEVGRRK